MTTTESLPQFEQKEFDHLCGQGYLRLGKLLSDDDVQALRQRADDIMLGKVRYEGMRFELDSESGRYDDRQRKSVGHETSTLAYRRVDDMHLDPLFMSFLRHDIFRSITRHMIGDDVSTYRAMLFNKPANRGTHLPWHRDGDHKGHEMVNIWTALDEATEGNGCMQLAKGSQFSDGDMWPEDDEVPEKIIHLIAEPGEGILLHNKVAHRSGMNTTSQARRAFAFSYVEASTGTDGRGVPLPAIFGAGS